MRTSGGASGRGADAIAAMLAKPEQLVQRMQPVAPRSASSILHAAHFLGDLRNLDRLLTSAAGFGFLGGVIDEVRERAQGGRDRTAAIQRFTRDLWRALRPSLMPDPRRPGWSERYLLQACEVSVARLAADPGSEPMASRTLFSAARSLMRVRTSCWRRTSSSGTSRAPATTSRPSGAPGARRVAALRRAQPQGQALRPRAHLGQPFASPTPPAEAGAGPLRGRVGSRDGRPPRRGQQAGRARLLR